MYLTNFEVASKSLHLLLCIMETSGFSKRKLFLMFSCSHDVLIVVF